MVVPTPVGIPIPPTTTTTTTPLVVVMMMLLIPPAVPETALPAPPGLVGPSVLVAARAAPALPRHPVRQRPVQRRDLLGRQPEARGARRPLRRLRVLVRAAAAIGVGGGDAEARGAGGALLRLRLGVCRG